MRKISVLALLLIVMLSNCSKNGNRTPKYSEFNNDYERDNLYGPVKSVTMYKANITDTKTEQTEEPILQYKKEYTDFGKISSFEFYDRTGKVAQYQNNEYNDQKQRIKSVSENPFMHSKSMEELKYDEKGNNISTKVTTNDTLQMLIMAEYDNAQHVIKTTSTQKKDTIISNYSYKYDDKGNVLSKKLLFTEYGKNMEQMNSYAYDKNGNMTEMKFLSEMNIEKKTVNEYNEQNLLIKRSEFENGKLTQETVYDKFYNPLLVKFYENAVLTKEIRSDYTFDEYSNWTQKKIYLKDYFGKENAFVPIFVERRTIAYYK